jgi:hypothetical protein
MNDAERIRREIIDELNGRGSVEVPARDAIEDEARAARERCELDEREALRDRTRERRERPARRERQHEPEGSWEDWNRWCDARIQTAIAVERAAIVQK